jgi:hypothetical protein
MHQSLQQDPTPALLVSTTKRSIRDTVLAACFLLLWSDREEAKHAERVAFARFVNQGIKHTKTE